MQIRPTKKISPSHLLNIVLVVVLAGVAVFGYFYLKKVDPVATVTNVLPETGPGQPKFLFNLWGSKTQNFGRPLDVTVSGNKIFALDSKKYVWVFDNTGRYITRFAGFGEKQGQLLDPQGLAAYNGKIYVADMKKKKVVVFNEDGQFAGYFAEKNLQVPYYIRVCNNKFFIQESFGVKVFDPSGKLLTQLGTRGIDQGQFGVSFGVDTDKDNNIYVMDTGNYRIQVFDAQGKFKYSWGRRPGMESADDKSPVFDYSQGLAFDKGGFIWISRPMSRMVSVIDPKTGKNLADIKDVEGTDKGFGGPTGLFIDQNNRLLVVDQVGRRIAVFQL